MRIEQIRQVIEIERIGSINGAAKDMYIAQSSLSTSIKSLESELKKEIFIRDGNKIIVTDFGKKFIESGKKILHHYQTILDCAGSDEIVANKHLYISVYFLAFASDVFSHLCSKHKDDAINFGIREQSRMETISSVSRGFSELGVLSMPSYKRHQWQYLVEAYNLEYVKLSDEPAQLIFGEKCDIFQENITSVSTEFLKNKRMVIIEDDNDIFKSINNHLIELTRPGSFLSICDRASLSGILHNQEAYFVGTRNQNAYQNDDAFYSGLKSVVISDLDDYRFEIGYVKSKEKELSTLAKEYLGMVEKCMGR